MKIRIMHIKIIEFDLTYTQSHSLMLSIRKYEQNSDVNETREEEKKLITLAPTLIVVRTYFSTSELNVYSKA